MPSRSSSSRWSSCTTSPAGAGSGRPKCGGAPWTGPSRPRARAGWPGRRRAWSKTASLNFFGKYAGPLALIVVAVALPLIAQRLLGRSDRSGLRLRRHLPVVDDRHRRGRNALVVPDHLRRGRSTDHCPAGQQPRLAGPGRGGGRGSRRPGHGHRGRVPEHPAGRPLRGPGDVDVRAAHGEPRFHAAQLREPRARPDPPPACFRPLRSLVRVRVPGRFHPGGPVHRQFPTVDHRARPQCGPLERGGRPGPRASASCR